MEEAIGAAQHGVEAASAARAGDYEHAFRVIGRYIDEQKPKDVFFFEQDGAFVVRLHRAARPAPGTTLAEFTRDDIAALVAQGPALRHAAPDRQPGRPRARTSA